MVAECGDYEGIQYCGRLLASLGASVVKIEPAEGDPLRRRPPGLPATGARPTSTAFEYLNAGKRGVLVDFASAQDLTTVHEICAAADVVIATTPYSSLLRLAECPRPEHQLRLSAGATGGGLPDGPTSSFVRFHQTATAYLLPSDKDRTHRPGWSGPYAFEAVHGTCMAAAVLAQLRGPAGGDIDYSYSAYSLWLEKMFVPRIATRQIPNLHRFTLAYPIGGNVACRDGYVCLFVIEEHQWHGLCQALERADWLSDPRYADGTGRVADQDSIQQAIEEWCSARSVDEVIATARRCDIPAGVVRGLDDVLRLEVLTERGFLQDGPSGSRLAGLPFGGDLRAEPVEPYRIVSPPGQWASEFAAGSGVGVRTVAEAPAPEVAAAAPRAPLAGVRVLDFTWAAAGPAITSMMAFLGADVVKVENRSRPDLMRIAGRQYGFGATDLNSSLMFQEIGAGKRSIELDLRDPDELAIAVRLAGAADVVVENMRPGKIERLGLSYADIRRTNPGVVMCSQSATGRVSGPSIPGYAPIFWAEGGGAALTGWPDGRPGIVRAPVDFHAATFAFVGLLALLRRRDETGVGGYVDCSAIEVVVNMFGVELMGLPAGRAERAGNGFPGVLFNDVVPCAGEDEWVAITVPDDSTWQALCATLGLGSEAAPVRPDAPDVIEQIGEATRCRLADELAAQLCAAGVPAARSASLASLLNDARLWERGAWQNIRHNSRDKHPIVGLPWTFDGEPYVLPRPSPRIGADTATVLLEWLGAGAAARRADR
jgi:crotonobetainyl-CoA:carnitine CoA-transferase CaiB-like acyl-CoA transferase